MHGSEYIDRVTEVTHKAWDSQLETIMQAADKLCETIARKDNVYVFGCSHAGILAEEVFYRTGGLAILNPIFFPGFALNTRPITLTSQLERLPGIGRILVEEHKLKAGDVLLHQDPAATRCRWRWPRRPASAASTPSPSPPWPIPPP